MIRAGQLLQSKQQTSAICSSYSKTRFFLKFYTVVVFHQKFPRETALTNINLEKLEKLVSSRTVKTAPPHLTFLAEI